MPGIVRRSRSTSGRARRARRRLRRSTKHVLLARAAEADLDPCARQHRERVAQLGFDRCFFTPLRSSRGVMFKVRWPCALGRTGRRERVGAGVSAPIAV